MSKTPVELLQIALDPRLERAGFTQKIIKDTRKVPAHAFYKGQIEPNINDLIALSEKFKELNFTPDEVGETLKGLSSGMSYQNAIKDLDNSIESIKKLQEQGFVASDIVKIFNNFRSQSFCECIGIINSLPNIKAVEELKKNDLSCQDIANIFAKKATQFSQVQNIVFDGFFVMCKKIKSLNLWNDFCQSDFCKLENIINFSKYCNGYFFDDDYRSFCFDKKAGNFFEFVQQKNKERQSGGFIKLASGELFVEPDQQEIIDSFIGREGKSDKAISDAKADFFASINANYNDDLAFNPSFDNSDSGLSSADATSPSQQKQRPEPRGVKRKGEGNGPQPSASKLSGFKNRGQELPQFKI